MYFLTDVDGVLCVANRMADWSEPRYIVNHFPTAWRTWDFCRDMEIPKEEMRERLVVKCEFPGCYAAVQKDGERLGMGGYGIKLQLVEGGRTKSAAVTFEPVPVPKTRKGDKLEWIDGRWHKCTPKGGWKTINV